MKATIIIPFYKHTLSAFEKIAFAQVTKVLSTHDIIAIKPHNLLLPPDVQPWPFTDVISFDDAYFKNVKGYNALMLAEEFYKRFLNYDFMLIYQLDAFVFSDQLMEWCEQGYDYVGAPWIHKYDYPDMVKAIKSKIQHRWHLYFDVQIDGRPSRMQFENKVGNGGFSLRRVKKFHDLCVSMQDQIQKYLSLNDDHYFNEDVFWGVEVNRRKKSINIPSYKKAVGFSVELFPERAVKINGGKLPFGCHAWDRNLEYWQPVFKNYGYEI